MKKLTKFNQTRLKELQLEMLREEKLNFPNGELWDTLYNKFMNIFLYGQELEPESEYDTFGNTTAIKLDNNQTYKKL